MKEYDDNAKKKWPSINDIFEERFIVAIKHSEAVEKQQEKKIIEDYVKMS